MRFRHPLCAVYRAPHSRDAMLAILQWYRILSPVLSVHVNHVTYDAEKNSAYLDITQVFHIRWSPFKPAPARYVLSRIPLLQYAPASSARCFVHQGEAQRGGWARTGEAGRGRGAGRAAGWAGSLAPRFGSRVLSFRLSCASEKGAEEAQTQTLRARLLRWMLGASGPYTNVLRPLPFLPPSSLISTN